MVHPLLIERRRAPTRSRPLPGLLSELFNHEPQQSAVSEVFLARQALLAGQMMAEELSYCQELPPSL